MEVEVVTKKLLILSKIDNMRNHKSSKLTVTWVPRDCCRVNVDDPEDELESFWFNVFWKFNEKIGVIYRSVRDVFDRERLLRDDPYLYFCILLNCVSLYQDKRLFKWVFIKLNMPSYR